MKKKAPAYTGAPLEASAVALLHGDVTDKIAGIPWAWHADRENHLPPVVVAFDLGVNSAAAILDGAHVETFKFRDPIASQLHAPMRAARWRAQGRPVLVGVEWCFVGPSPTSALALARRAGAVCALAEVESLPAVRVLATRWQAGLWAKRAPREEGKARHRVFAESLAPERVKLNEDECDAVCFAAWLAGIMRA
jgi:hypothetical protein